MPNSSLSEAPQSLDIASWAACRSSQCGASLGACTPSQGPTPYAAYRNVTAATIIQQDWNALGRSVTKTCNVLGIGQQQFINMDNSLGPYQATLFVTCDYQGTAIVPSIALSRQAIDAGNTAPPPSSPPPPPTQLPPGKAAPATSTSPQALPPPAVQPSPQNPSPNTSVQGPAVSFVATLPTYSISSFDDGAQAQYTATIQQAILGCSAPPTVRIRSVVASGSTGGTGNRRMLLASGVDVDTVVDFVPTDTTAASAFLTMLQTSPATVFPPAEYGAVTVQEAAQLNCITPCGLHGNTAPRISPTGTISCTCECQSGWATAPNQAFDSFKYCTLRTSDGGNATGDSVAGNSTAGQTMGEYPSQISCLILHFFSSLPCTEAVHPCLCPDDGLQLRMFSSGGLQCPSTRHHRRCNT